MTFICSTVLRYIANRFDPKEDITHGVETMNLCEISVDVADVGSDSWSLKTEEDAQTKMSGNVVSKYTPCLYWYYSHCCGSSWIRIRSKNTRVNRDPEKGPLGPNSIPGQR